MEHLLIVNVEVPCEVPYMSKIPRPGHDEVQYEVPYEYKSE